MIRLIKAAPAQFKFPRLFLDFTAGRLPVEFRASTLLDRTALDSTARSAAGARVPGAAEFWAAVRDYDARLGAGRAALRNIEALQSGSATPVIAGQQPGLLGGPLYTIYKTMTAVALCEHFASARGVNAVPVLWNACDDSDFLEVASASFFTTDLERKKLTASEHGHVAGRMVGSLGVDPIREVSRELWSLFGDEAAYRGARYLKGVTEAALSRGRDWGELFSSLYLGIMAAWGVVVVDARQAARSAAAAPVFSAYLRASSKVEEKVLERLKALGQLGYEEPVSGRSAESCVFVREGDVRRKPLRDEHPKLLAHAEKGDADLLPNVLLGPVLRDGLMAPLAHVLGPSEVCYSMVSGVVSSALGFEQTRVLPRMSLTVVPAGLVSELGGEEGATIDAVLSFDRRLLDYVERSLPPDLKKELESAETEVRSGLERLKLLAAATGRGVEDVTNSSSRKIDFELRRTREEFVSNAKKKALSANPRLRFGSEFLLPNGNLQERAFCSLAPLLAGGEAFLTQLKDAAGEHVADCLEGGINHHLLVTDAV